MQSQSKYALADLIVSPMLISVKRQMLSQWIGELRSSESKRTYCKHTFQTDCTTEHTPHTCPQKSLQSLQNLKPKAYKSELRASSQSVYALADCEPNVDVAVNSDAVAMDWRVKTVLHKTRLLQACKLENPELIVQNKLHHAHARKPPKLKRTTMRRL